MKKSLLALAVLGAFAGVASAQSSVTIYGQIDQGITKGNGGTAPNTGGNATSEAWQLKQAHGSRLGFRGNEDLGGGLSAQFLIEHRFQPDTGTGQSNVTSATSPTSVFWDGGSYVQLTSAAAGSVYFGRWYTPAFWVNLKSDPFGYDGVAQVGSKGFAGFLTPGPVAGGVRTSNTVGYKTPNWGGFTANVAVGLSEATNGRDTGFNAEYTAGPIYAGLGYEKVSGGPAGGIGSSVDGNSLVNVGVAYNFGVVRPIVYFARSKTGVGSVNTNKLLEVALTAPIGPGVLKAMVLRYTPQDDKKETKFGIGYDYFLSKRTRVYADFGQGKKTGVNTAATPAGTGYSNNSAYNLGVRHDF
jgi:predicted porin